MSTGPDSPHPRPAPPHVLQVNSTLHIGGAERVASLLTRYVDRDKFHVTSCYLKGIGEIGEEMLAAGTTVVPVPGLQEGRRDYGTSLKLRKHIRSTGAAIIHTHDIHGLIDGSLCRISMPGMRHVHTFHFGDYRNRAPRHGRLERILWRVPDAIVAVGHVQSAALSACYRIPPSRIRVIWNGVEKSETKSPQPSLASHLPPGIPVIASISTITRQKGLNDLLKAAADLKQSGERFRLLVAGDGPLRSTLLEESRRLGLADTVQFLGWVTEASSKLLPLCDIFVQSSLWEAMSVVVLEAMAAGKPLVVTAVGENPHIISDGETGLIVPPADHQRLAGALRTLLRDRELAARLGQAARVRHAQRFTTAHMVSAYETLYRELLMKRIEPERGRPESRPAT